jgi:plastocyanin
MRRSTRTLATGLALTAAIALGACGSSSDTPSAASTKLSTTTTAAPTGTDCVATPGQTVTVDIGAFVFDPTPVAVKLCDSVVWKNTHDQAHTSTGNGAKTWSTGNIAPGATSQPVVFDRVGTLTYMCALHPFMKGAVEVS